MIITERDICIRVIRVGSSFRMPEPTTISCSGLPGIRTGIVVTGVGDEAGTIETGGPE
jgi:hypothetical protein